MASARGDALDWALALARAPGERHALRQRPLPAGMEALLQIAGGSHAAAIAEAATHAGITPAELVEAARFYLRQMLFFPEADAYRVLGLSADASEDQIKHHHRLLQQWLHPDRPSSDWDTAFAARVNAAWSQLRTSARRKAYAATLPATAAATPSAPGRHPATRIHAPVIDAERPDPAFDAGRWHRRAPVLALFGVCAVLGVLAVRDLQREPDPGLRGGNLAAKAPTRDALVVALQLPATRTAPTASTPAAVTVANKPIQKRRPPQSAVVAVPKPLQAPAQPPTPALAQVAAGTLAAVVAAAAPTSAATASVPVPAMPPVQAEAVGVPIKPAARTVAASPPVAVKPVVTPAAVAPTPPAAPAIARDTPVAGLAAKPASLPAPPPAPAPNPAVAAAAVASPASVAAPAAHSPAQVAQAQQTGQRLLAFVAGRGGGMPPIWANYAAQTQASHAREALQGHGRVVVGQPDWRVGDHSAAMQASLTPGGGDARRLRVDMVWREQRWLIQSLALEQAR